ncbi:hypothetical protein OSB04_015315 [Centaurea solstitialis]|uniref:Uncharacterized protein n=1 Tax=Centaurea solstitialis TaxID=347529 RepID=A0AA38WGF3_9ASTR|nr:hypothetical protein OSB04_015315 [Centaurea solstitialis]
MASSGKFDLSSSSPGRPLYTSGKRGSHTASSMERSTSFRESMDNPILSSLPSMSRSTINVSQGDVTNFFQCLRFDLKSMAAEYKCNRHGDFKRLANAALCASDDSPSGSLKGKLPSSSPEDLKRFKVGLRESTIKARERVKIFSEVLSVINKCFPSIPSRKRSRPDAFSSDRSNALLPDRTAVGKMGTQSHVSAGAFDYEQQKVEERGKVTIPNKRTRTSLVDQRTDVRPNTPARSSGSVDRDREMLRLPSSNSLQSEDRALPIVADGWEKAKMKKKRSGIKVDGSPSTSSLSAKPIDGCREPRQGMHPRSLPDAKSRLNDPHGFRPGAANGGIGAGKADGTAQQASMGIRSSIPRPDQENTSFFHDKRDPTNNLELERTNVRALNKANVREDLISGTPTTKLHAAARGPRSGSGVIPKLSHVQRATISNGLESPHGTSKSPGGIGSTNRKRTLSTRSSSPPVAQWADRRPQKMSRTARRTNLVPVVSTNDEGTVFGNGDVTVGEKGRGFVRRFPANSPKQFKAKGDHLHSSPLSESEESGAAEIRSRDNGSKSEEVEQKAGQKMSTSVLPTRKNKLMSENDLAHGVCRQGRTGRGMASARSVAPVQKLGMVGTAKQLRTGRVGFDKPESKLGRPPTRKLAGRKAYMRQKHSAITAATDFLVFIVASDDGHEELLAAVNAVINPSCALSNPFWRQMDPLFRFVSDADVTYIKQEGTIRSTINIAKPIDGCDTQPNGNMLVESGTGSSSECSEHLISGTFSGGISLCQRLLTALISEDNNNEYTWCGNDDMKYDVYGFEAEPDIESSAINLRSLQNYELGGSFSSSQRVDSTLRSCNEVGHSQSDNHVMSMADSAVATGFDHYYNGQLTDPAIITSPHYQYADMSMDERLLIEIHSLGLSPARVPDLVHPGDEDVGKDISRLEEKHNQQVSRKKSLLNKLLKSTEKAKELHEKEFEQLSLDKLTGMAYQKYMSCWGPNAPGGKGASGKMAKQAALNCVKRTLDRCHEFEATGKSCFADPLFREMFLSGLSRVNDAEIDAAVDGESVKVSMEKLSGTQSSPLLNNYDIYPSDALVGLNHSSDQTIGKDDVWSSRAKKRELYLDDVVGTSSTPSAVGRAIMNSAKGKRSDRDILSRNGGPKIGRPASNVKGERKTKAKLKQKTTQLSASVNGPLGKISGPKPTEMKSSAVKEKDEFKFLENSEEPLDLSHLQLPGMEELGDDFGGQGQDIGSWLNIDDDVLQDDDFMGLEIPMDDLTDLNMMV